MKCLRRRAGNKIQVPQNASSDGGRQTPRGVLSCNLLRVSLVLLAIAGCNVDERRSGIPAEAQATIDKVTEQIAAGRYEEIYNEAAEEWRSAATSAQSKTAIEQVRERLGKVASRTLHAGRDQNNASGDLPGHSLTITYQTTFERGTGMETFTLVEREGRWLLARYFVSSDALK